MASIFELPLEQCPDNNIWCSPDHINWLFKLGYATIETDVLENFYGYHFIIGTSPRVKIVNNVEYPIYHCCVGFNGVIVHDPHPDRTKLASKSEFWWFIKLNPATK